MSDSPKYDWEAEIKGIEGMPNASFVDLPFDVPTTFGTKGWVKIKATFDGVEYRGSLADMGQGHFLLLRKDIREKIGKSVGDTVNVTLERDLEERTVEVPTELQDLLSSDATLRDFYENLSYTNRKEYARWIAEAKRPETKDKRLKMTKEKLKLGKKNPFEK